MFGAKCPHLGGIAGDAGLCCEGQGQEDEGGEPHRQSREIKTCELLAW